MDVLFVTAGDRTQASSRLRVYELLPFLKQAGISTHTIAVPEFQDSVWELSYKIEFAQNVFLRACRSDIVFVQKVRLPEWFTKILNHITKNLVYDFDDAIHLAPPGKNVSENKVSQHETLIASSDLTVAGSRDLVEYAEQFNDNVYCLHTGLPKEKYKQYQNLTDIGEDSICLGWIGNPENLHYLADVEDQINNALEEYDNLELRIITAGSLPVRPLEYREGDDVEYVEWSLETALIDLSEVDVGLRPLRNDEWTRSKGGFTSIIECLALGIPVIASPVALVKYLIRDGKNGFLAYNSEEWIDSLSEVSSNPFIINSMAQNCIDTVSKYEFWTKDTAEGMIRILKEVDKD